MLNSESLCFILAGISVRLALLRGASFLNFIKIFKLSPCWWNSPKRSHNCLCRRRNFWEKKTKAFSFDVESLSFGWFTLLSSFFQFLLFCVFVCIFSVFAFFLSFCSSIFLVAVEEALKSKVISFLQELHDLISVALMINTVVVIICEKGKGATRESFLANCNVKKKSQR